MVDLVPPRCSVFRLEDGFAPMEQWLDDLTGTTWSRRINRVHTRDQLLMEKGLAPTHRPIRTPDSLTLIAELYAADLDRYGYYAEQAPPEATDPAQAKVYSAKA